MNTRRGFFGSLIGAAAALVGVKPPPPNFPAGMCLHPTGEGGARWEDFRFESVIDADAPRFIERNGRFVRVGEA